MITRCFLGDRPGFRYGLSGSVFTYQPGDREGERNARRQAHLQGAKLEAGVLSVNELVPPLLPDTLREDGNATTDVQTSPDGDCVLVSRAWLMQLKEWVVTTIDEFLACDDSGAFDDASKV